MSLSAQAPREILKDASYWASINSTLADARNVDLLVKHYNDAVAKNQNRLFMYIQMGSFIQKGFLLNMEAICYSYSAGERLDSIREIADNWLRKIRNEEDGP